MYTLTLIIFLFVQTCMYNGDTVAPNTGSGTSIRTNTEDTRLGLVYNVGKMYLKKSVVNTLVGVAMPATKNYSDFSDTIKKIKADLKKLESIDILKSDPYKAECSPIINAIYFDIGTIQKAVSDLGNFMDNSATEPRPYNCLLTLDEITVQDREER